MIRQKAVIASDEGMHARPAAEFCKAAGKFKSKITVWKDKEAFEAKSILMVLSMGACKGEEIEIMAEGADEEAAVKTLVKLVEREC